MPAKKSQSTKADIKVADAVDEAPLQAVVLADSYNRRFEVLCQDQPRVLLPLCSVPLLHWTLESLSLSHVKQVFVFCGVHAEKIKEFVATSPHRHYMDIQCLSSTTARTAGDALRELDVMGVLNADIPFVLVHSPLVSNYDISKMVEAHKQRRETDKNFIMTIGVGRGGPPHPESPIMLVHPPSSRLLHYVSSPLLPTHHRVSFPSNLFTDPFPTDIDTYEIWSGSSPHSKSHVGGYRDLGVDICELDVPALCTENFDYHDMRRHFVNGVLTSELLGKKIAVHLVGTEHDDGKGDIRSGDGGKYIERVRDTRTFGEITRDVLRRWAFPLVPDVNDPVGASYELRKGNVYIARDNVVLSRTTSLTGPLLIGPRTSLAQGTKVYQSTLGADCSLGPNTTVSQSYIFDNVVIGADCSLDNCMIGKDVSIADGVKVGRGVLIGNGVRIGKGVFIPDFARVGRERWVPEYADEEDEIEGEEEKARRLRILGNETVGFLWPQEEEEPASDSEDEGEDPYEHPRNKKLLQLGRTLSHLSVSTDSLSTLSAASSSAASTPATDASDDESLPDIPSLSLDAVPPAFHTEASASLARAYEEEHSVENARLELRTLVMGYNAGIDAARKEVTNFLMSKTNVTGSAATILVSTTALWERWGELATSLAPELSNIALDAQAWCVQHEDFRPYFGIVLRALYDAEIVAEEDLIEWRSLSTARGVGVKDDADRAVWEEVYGKGKTYVDVLEQMESESEDEDEDDA